MQRVATDRAVRCNHRNAIGTVTASATRRKLARSDIGSQPAGGCPAQAQAYPLETNAAPSPKASITRGGLTPRSRAESVASTPGSKLPVRAARSTSARVAAKRVSTTVQRCPSDRRSWQWRHRHSVRNRWWRLLTPRPDERHTQGSSAVPVLELPSRLWSHPPMHRVPLSAR